METLKQLDLAAKFVVKKMDANYIVLSTMLQ